MLAHRLAALLLALCVALSPQAADAERALVIRSDRGGLITAKLERIAALRDSGQRVEVRGTCLSSCTLHLDLDATCIAPTATLGFHGPSSYGQRLHPNDFERWSQLIARHYKPALRAWYLETGRYRLRGYYRLKGTQLIAMGYAAC